MNIYVSHVEWFCIVLSFIKLDSVQMKFNYRWVILMTFRTKRNLATDVYFPQALLSVRMKKNGKIVQRWLVYK